MNRMQPAALEASLRALPGALEVRFHGGAWWARGYSLDVHAMATALRSQGLRLGTLTAVPLAPQGETRVVYHWLAAHQFVNVETVTRQGALPSLAPRLRAAGWAEREIHDLFGVHFEGHPNPAPLLRPEGFAVGMLRSAMCGPAVLARSPTLALSKDLP